MNTAPLGEGHIGIEWTKIRGVPGITPQLTFQGVVTAAGYGYGAIMQISADVYLQPGDKPAATYLGSIGPINYILNKEVKSYFSEISPCHYEDALPGIELRMPMPHYVTDSIEDLRQGGRLSLRIETKATVIANGLTSTEDWYSKNMSRMLPQQVLAIGPEEWGAVIEQFGRGVGIFILVPFISHGSDSDWSNVIRFIKLAKQRIDVGDYSGAFTEGRKALEILRRLTPDVEKGKRPQSLSPSERVSRIVDDLFSYASANAHSDGAIQGFVPARPDAIALVASTAAIAQQVFTAS